MMKSPSKKTTQDDESDKDSQGTQCSNSSETSIEQKNYFKPRSHFSDTKSRKNKVKKLEECSNVSNVSKEHKSKEKNNESQEKTKTRQKKLSMLAKRIDEACERMQEISSREKSVNLLQLPEIPYDVDLESGDESIEITGVPRLEIKTSSLDISEEKSKNVAVNSSWHDDSYDQLDSEVDFTTGNLKKRLGEWLHGSGTVSKLRSYFRGLVVSAIDEIPLVKMTECSSYHECICLLIVDFLLRNKMEFSVCVFCSEIVNLLDGYQHLKSLATMLINQEVLPDTKEPMMDRSIVSFILTTLNIHPNGMIGSGIVSSYYNEESSLIMIILKRQYFDCLIMKQLYDQDEQAQLISFISQYKFEFKNIVSKTFNKVQELKLIQTQASQMHKADILRVQAAEAKKYDEMLNIYKLRQKRLVNILKEVERCMVQQKENFKKACIAEEGILLDYGNKLTKYFNELKEHMKIIEERELMLENKERELEDKVNQISPISTIPQVKFHKINFPPPVTRQQSYSSLQRSISRQRRKIRARLTRHENVSRPKSVDPSMNKDQGGNIKAIAVFSRPCQTSVSLPPCSDFSLEVISDNTFAKGDFLKTHNTCFQLHDENAQLKSIIFEQQKRIEGLTKRTRKLIETLSSQTQFKKSLSLPLSSDTRARSLENLTQQSINNLAILELSVSEAKNRCFKLKMESEMVECLYDDCNLDEIMEAIANNRLIDTEWKNNQQPETNQTQNELDSNAARESLSSKSLQNSESGLLQNSAMIYTSASVTDISVQPDESDRPHSGMRTEIAQSVSLERKSHEDVTELSKTNDITVMLKT